MINKIKIINTSIILQLALCVCVCVENAQDLFSAALQSAVPNYELRSPCCARGPPGTMLLHV